MYNTESFHLLDLAACTLVVWVLVNVYKRVSATVRTTRVRGPARTSWIWGFNRDLLAGRNGEQYEQWAAEYGPVFRLPSELGTNRLVLTDPRAVAHVLSTNSYNYRRSEGGRAAVRHLLGDGILSAEGDDHKRQRKVLNPGFTPQAIRQFTTIFFESAHKVEESWNSLIADAKDQETVIDVQKWMNRVSLDTIGLAGFSHDFGTLHGEQPAVVRVFESFGAKLDFISALTFLLITTVPAIIKLPSPRNNRLRDLNDSMDDVVKKVLGDNTPGKVEDKERFYMLGPLLKADDTKLAKSELVAQVFIPNALSTFSNYDRQMKTLILAGYETTANSLSWCLHELSMRPSLQQRLRDELVQYPEPTYDQIISASHMPVLDAVLRETLRTHPPVVDNTRVVAADDSIPLSAPLVTDDGQTVDHIDVVAGSTVTVPIEGMNRSKALWGPTAHEYDPDRWVKGDIPQAAQEIQGFHHLLTFIDGPRHCIGKNFAVTEFKVVLAVLIRKFIFIPLDGTGENVGSHRGILSRPQTKGAEAGCLFLKVRHVEG